MSFLALPPVNVSSMGGRPYVYPIITPAPAARTGAKCVRTPVSTLHPADTQCLHQLYHNWENVFTD